MMGCGAGAGGGVVVGRGVAVGRGWGFSQSSLLFCHEQTVSSRRTKLC